MPDPNDSPWTTETLFVFTQQRFADMATAIVKADIASEKRFDSVNEFRNTLKDAQQTYVTRGELYAMLGVTGTFAAIMGALIARLFGAH
jgi:hypothetical protein